MPSRAQQPPRHRDTGPCHKSTRPLTPQPTCKERTASHITTPARAVRSQQKRAHMSLCAFHGASVSSAAPLSSQPRPRSVQTSRVHATDTDGAPHSDVWRDLTLTISCHRHHGHHPGAEAIGGREQLAGSGGRAAHAEQLSRRPPAQPLGAATNAQPPALSARSSVKSTCASRHPSSVARRWTGMTWSFRKF